MDRTDRLERWFGRILYTVLAVVLVCAIIVTMVFHMYKTGEEEAYEMLHLETSQIKKDINLQMLSDRENLVTLARLAAKMHQNGEDYELIFESFKAIGLFENIRILLPDGTLITKEGTMQTGDEIDFEAEVLKGERVSGRVHDLTNFDREVVRSAVPINDESGRTIAILYGIIELETLKDHYMDDAKAAGADLFVIEGGNGNFIIDTKNRKLGNITEYVSAVYGEGYSYDTLVSDLTYGQSGFSSYLSKKTNEYYYAHYAPLAIADWQIMLAKPESEVFANAKSIGTYLTLMALAILLIMFLYVGFLFEAERRKQRVSVYASKIRKNLLLINQQTNKLDEALKDICEFSNARAAFIVDNYGVEYNHIVPDKREKALSKEERKYFVKMLLKYEAQQQNRMGANVLVLQINFEDLRYEMPEFCEFALSKDIKNVVFASVSSNNSVSNILGVLNFENKRVSELLKEIAICFSMSVYNKNYLSETESLALTDSLTGTANRMAYKQDVKLMEMKSSENYACIYVDVNELHYYNDKNGHAAGDQMLVFVTEVLNKAFPESRLYRMGGDEFLLFVFDMSMSEIEEKLNVANEKIEAMKYHVSVGVSYNDGNVSVEELVGQAEKLMYEKKAEYYHNKEQKRLENLPEHKMEMMDTGIKEVDCYFKILSEKYLGVYCVNHSSDSAHQIMSSSYLAELVKASEGFKESLHKYTYDIVKAEYHRTMIGLLDYDVIEKQLKSSEVVKIAYVKFNDEKVILNIYKSEVDEFDTIWIFERDTSED